LRLALERGIGPPIVASKQVGEPRPIVVIRHRFRLKLDAVAGKAQLRLPLTLLVGVREGLALRIPSGAPKRVPPHAQVRRGVVRDGSGRPSRVHQVPAAVIVASRADREPSRQIKRPPNHCRTCVVRLQYGLEPAFARDAIGIEEDQPTFNLEGFTMRTSESEFKRVVRHEAGHTLGFDHEHMRADLVSRIDRNKAIAYYDREEGWTTEETIEQVLTPLSKRSIMGTLESDPHSIMCYQIPGEITKDGKTIPGGLDINAKDYKFAGTIYPVNAGRIPRDRAHSSPI